MIHVVRAEKLDSVSALKNKYGYKSPPGREKKNLQFTDFLIFSLDETDFLVFSVCTFFFDQNLHYCYLQNSVALHFVSFTNFEAIL
jgi:hypothetical protein